MTSSVEQCAVFHASRNVARTKPRRTLVQDLAASIIALVVFVVVSYLLRRSLSDKPFVLIFLVGALCTTLSFFRTHSPWLRKLQISFATSFACLFLLEAGFIAAGRFGIGPCDCRQVGGYSPSAYVDCQTDLGYRPVPGARVNSRKICGSRELYDVVYSIDEQGQRMTKGNPAGDTILFLGCSFTFGEGVEDDQSLPAVTSRLLDFRYNVVNFGFHGWGPHQMLRILETQREANRVSGRLRQVVYLAIPDHVKRCVGGFTWDPSGPRYELDPAGGVSYQGPLKSGTNALLTRLMGRSHLGKFVFERLHAVSLRRQDFEVFAEIVAASRDIVRERYDAPFSVLVWYDTGSPGRSQLLDALRAKGLAVIDAAELVTSDQVDKLTIAPGRDEHPNRLAYERVAPFLIAKIFPDRDEAE